MYLVDYDIVAEGGRVGTCVPAMPSRQQQTHLRPEIVHNNNNTTFESAVCTESDEREREREREYIYPSTTQFGPSAKAGCN